MKHCFSSVPPKSTRGIAALEDQSQPRARRSQWQRLFRLINSSKPAGDPRIKKKKSFINKCRRASLLISACSTELREERRKARVRCSSGWKKKTRYFSSSTRARLKSFFPQTEIETFRGASRGVESEGLRLIAGSLVAGALSWFWADRAMFLGTVWKVQLPIKDPRERAE